ncbi:MAG: ABC transporter permease [Thalassobaculales bacterium]
MPAAIVLAGLVLAVLAAPLVEAALGVDAVTVDLIGRLEPPAAPHLLGTDELGRDVLARLLRGGQISLLVGIATALLAAAIGTLVGLVAGFRGGTADALLMRLTDGVIALPLLPLLIVLAAVDPGKLGLAPTPELAVARIVLLVALVGWTTTARVVRAVVLSLRERAFVEAAVAAGAGPARILAVHILPHCAAPILVATTLSVGNVILLESALSFLGLGVPPPLASWGSLLTGAQELIWTAPQLALYPGLLIFATVVSVNLLGDRLQRMFDPQGAR